MDSPTIQTKETARSNLNPPLPFFYMGMSLFFMLLVFIGFGPSYFMPILGQKASTITVEMSWIVHVHAIIYLAWITTLAHIETDAHVYELRHSNIDLLFHNPSIVEFLGGLEYVAPGKTAYTELDMKPVRYAWLVHDLQKDTVKTFTIE